MLPPFATLPHLRATGLSPVLVQARPHLLATKSYMSSCAVCITGGRGTLAGSNRASMSTLVRPVTSHTPCLVAPRGYTETDPHCPGATNILALVRHTARIRTWLGWRLTLLIEYDNDLKNDNNNRQVKINK